MGQGNSTVFVSTFLAQAAGAVLLSIVLLSFYRYYRRSYLLHWTWSWWALTIYLISGSFGIYSFRFLRASDPVRVVLSLISQISSYWQVAWLLFGAYDVSSGREVPRRLVRQVLVLTTLIGTLSTVLFWNDPGVSVGRLFIRVGIRSLVTGVAFVVAAFAVWRSRGTDRLGPTVVSTAFLLHGLQQLQSFGSLAFPRAGEEMVGLSVYMEFLDLVVLFVTGIGMVIWFLEVERDRVLRASEAIEHMAYHDSLTRLPNRQLFLDRLQLTLAQAYRAGKNASVLFLDLDRFKSINDTLGHTVGDELLRAVADRVRKIVREGDTVARLGGDEFTLLLPEGSRDDAQTVAIKLKDALRRPFALHGQELFVSSSIGISMYPEDGADAETLLKNADTAMYRAKELGRDCHQFYAPAMNARALERLSLENDLRRAVPNGEFTLHYQPFASVRDMDAWGAEALLRWNHPTRGLLLPGEFLYLAEVSGIMEELNRWVLDSACRQLAIWQNSIRRDFSISVNVSGRYFQHAAVVAEVERVIQTHAIQPEALVLEITETTAMQNADVSLTVLRGLKALGVRIAIDDFGTGYSSLSYLRTFPIDILKIDRSFVREMEMDPQSQGIAAAVIALAHGLKIQVVAEGVEKEEQLRLLRERDCDEFQGYLLSKPAPAQEIERFISSQKHHGR